MKTLAQYPKPNKQTVTVIDEVGFYQDNQVTGVELMISTPDGVYLVKGSARRFTGDSELKADKNDERLGRILALSRALESASIGFRKQAEGLMKHNEDIPVIRANQKAKKAALRAEQDEFYRQIAEAVSVDDIVSSKGKRVKSPSGNF